MVALQIISKVLATKDYSLISDNCLTEEYFPEYKEEFNYIKNHYDKYGNVPDKESFLSHFSMDGETSIELVEVTESDKYLIDTIREEHLWELGVPVVQKIANLFKSDANEAVQYMMDATKELKPNYDIGGVDIIHKSGDRYQQFVDRKNNQDEWFFTTGFPELDDLIHGIQRREEFILIFARTNQGKSWILEKICTHIWEIGYNVGYMSPEMSASSIGYRFDTLHKNFSNTSLTWSNEQIKEKDYKEYTKKLTERPNSFIVSTPADFNKEITVSKLKQWIEKYKLDAIFIDGISYMKDERYKRGDSKTTSLTNISEDLMELSVEMGVPVLVVQQANRGGTQMEGETDTPELENIRDSDGIAYNASKVISLRQLQNEILVMQLKKARGAKLGGKLNYNWNIDTGEFTYIPSLDDSEPIERKKKVIKENKKKFNDATDVF